MKLCVHVCEQMCSPAEHMHACKCMFILLHGTCLCVHKCSWCEQMCDVQINGLRSLCWQGRGTDTC